MIKEGDLLPDFTFMIRDRFYESNEMYVNMVVQLEGHEPKDSWKELNVHELFKNKRNILIGVPGAFTPTCAKAHLPGFETDYLTIKSYDIDDIYCVGVNDPWVMWAWQKKQGIFKVGMLPDGMAEYCEKLGTLVNMTKYKYGKRTWRFSMVVEDLIVEKMFIEDGYPDNYIDDPYDHTSSVNMIKYLKSVGRTRDVQAPSETGRNLPADMLNYTNHELESAHRRARHEYEEYMNQLKRINE